MLPLLGLSAFKPAEEIFGAAGHLLGIGGKSDAEKADIRVARARDLLGCAQRGDIAAARTVLAEQTYSSQPEGRQAYTQAWQQLLSSRPDVAAEAQRQGALRDSTSSGACTRFELGAAPAGAPPAASPPMATLPSGIVPPSGFNASSLLGTGLGIPAGSSSALLPLAALGLLAVVVLKNK